MMYVILVLLILLAVVVIVAMGFRAGEVAARVELKDALRTLDDVQGSHARALTIMAAEKVRLERLVEQLKTLNTKVMDESDKKATPATLRSELDDLLSGGPSTNVAPAAAGVSADGVPQIPPTK